MRCCHFISHYTAELLPPNSTLWGCIAAAASNSNTIKGYTTSNTTTSNSKILQGCAAASQLLHTIFQRCTATAVSPLHNIKTMRCCLLLLLLLPLAAAAAAAADAAAVAAAAVAAAAAAAAAFFN